MQKYETIYQRHEQRDEESSDIHPRESRTARQDESSSSSTHRSPQSQPQSHQQKRTEQRGKGKWCKTVDVSSFRPHEVKVKVDPIFHTLHITAQRVINPWNPAQAAPACNKLKRVIPLPENICLEKLRVHMNVEAGELLMKAPFQGREDILTKQQCHQQHDDTDSTCCVKIPITWKSQQPQSQHVSTTSFLSALQLPRTAGTFAITPCDITKLPVQEYLRLLKQSPMRSSSEPCAAALNKNIATEVVKDENSGKWKLFIDIIAVGFRREEVNVTFEEKERLLVVEMCHEKSKVMPRIQEKTTTTTTATHQTTGAAGSTTQQSELQREHEPARMTAGVGATAGHISLKHVREEILLPEWLEGKQMSFRVMENGVLRIQLPCLREPYPTDREADEQKWNRVTRC